MNAVVSIGQQRYKNWTYKERGVSVMSSVFWNNSHNYFSGLFGNASNNSGLTNSLFGGGSNMLGDYSMIKSGAYKKLTGKHLILPTGRHHLFLQQIPRRLQGFWQPNPMLRI